MFPQSPTDHKPYYPRPQLTMDPLPLLVQSPTDHVPAPLPLPIRNHSQIELYRISKQIYLGFKFSWQKYPQNMESKYNNLFLSSKNFIENCLALKDLNRGGYKGGATGATPPPEHPVAPP